MRGDTGRQEQEGMQPNRVGLGDVRLTNTASSRPAEGKL